MGNRRNLPYSFFKALQPLEWMLAAEIQQMQRTAFRQSTHIRVGQVEEAFYVGNFNRRTMLAKIRLNPALSRLACRDDPVAQPLFVYDMRRRLICALAVYGFQALRRPFQRRHGGADNALGLPASGEMHRPRILHCDFNIPVQSPVPHVQLLLLGTWHPCLLQGDSENCQMGEEQKHLPCARPRNGNPAVSAQDARSPARSNRTGLLHLLLYATPSL